MQEVFSLFVLLVLIIYGGIKFLKYADEKEHIFKEEKPRCKNWFE